MPDQDLTPLPVLQAGPHLEPRRATVPVPEWGGQVIVRGLLASEAFALEAQRGTALHRVREARAEHAATVREARARYDDRCASLPPGAAPPAWQPPAFQPPSLTTDELAAYARVRSELLAMAVITPAGLALYSADQWEVAGQHHPQVVDRLLAEAERLSGMNAEDVEKN